LKIVLEFREDEKQDFPHYSWGIWGR
jgi:hypothetical protein